MRAGVADAHQYCWSICTDTSLLNNIQLGSLLGPRLCTHAVWSGEDWKHQPTELRRRGDRAGVSAGPADGDRAGAPACHATGASQYTVYNKKSSRSDGAQQKHDGTSLQKKNSITKCKIGSVVLQYCSIVEYCSLRSISGTIRQKTRHYCSYFFRVHYTRSWNRNV